DASGYGQPHRRIDGLRRRARRTCQRPGRRSVGPGCGRSRPLGLSTLAPTREGLAARQAAARLLGAVIERKTSADGLTDERGGNPHFLALPPRDRALVRAILSAALRHRLAIAALIDGQ